MDGPRESFVISAIGVVFTIFFLLCLYLLIAIWPTKSPFPETVSVQTAVPIPAVTTAPAIVGQNAGNWNPNVRMFGYLFQLSSDVRFLLLVVLSAALGSLVSMATSFTTFVGNRAFVPSWLWWYILRTPIGIGLALLFYFAVRGGFFTSVSSFDLNPYGIAALGGLVGMFSKQAADKLHDVFVELFRSSQDQKRLDKLSNPSITATVPPVLTAGTTQLTMMGNGFLAGASVTVNGKARNAKVVDLHTITVTLDPSDLQSGATLNVLVTNPGPGGGTSAHYAVRVA